MITQTRGIRSSGISRELIRNHIIFEGKQFLVRFRMLVSTGGMIQENSLFRTRQIPSRMPDPDRNDQQDGVARSKDEVVQDATSRRTLSIVVERPSEITPNTNHSICILRVPYPPFDDARSNHCDFGKGHWQVINPPACIPSLHHRSSRIENWLKPADDDIMNLSLQGHTIRIDGRRNQDRGGRVQFKLIPIIF